MKYTVVILGVILTCLLSSCSQSKQFSSCSNMAYDLRYKHYNDLVKDWGEPIKKEQFNSEWDVVWDGVGVNGKNVLMKFDSSSIGSEIYPDTFIGIVDCD